MKELNFITKEEYELAKMKLCLFVPQEVKGIKAPHFFFL